MSFSSHRRRKSFGQHWIKDIGVLEKILNSANLSALDRVLEIGPGHGALTQKLLEANVNSVHAIEIDKSLINSLMNKFAHYQNLNLIEADFLSLPFSSFGASPPNKVVANIPYNITGPLLERLVGKLGIIPEIHFELLVLLVQKEVADRILASPGDSSFSALSVRMQLLSNSYNVCDVPPSCFEPRPKVYSKVIIIRPYKACERLSLEIENKVERLLKVAFLERRKKLRNTLISFSKLELLEDLAKNIGVSLDQRPQELSPTNWIDLAKGIKLLTK